MALDREELTSEDIEIIISIYQLATLLTLLTNKKIGFQNLFIQILEDNKFNLITKELLEQMSDIEICRNLLLIDPNLVKSKALLTFAKTRGNA